MDQIAPYLSYGMLVLFGLTCVITVIGVSVNVAKPILRLIVTLGLSFAGLMGVASGILYIWHWYYR